MEKTRELFDQMHQIIEHIPETAQKYKDAGKKLIGVLPIYTPEELIYAAGMLPFGCWGGQVTISKAAAYLPPFACSIMQAVMELALSGSYDILDGLVISVPCDTLKCLTQNFKSACPNVKQIVCVYPQNNKLEASVTYLVKHLTKIKASLEEIAGKEITEDALQEAIAVYNENRRALMEFCSLVAEKPGLVSAKDRHAVIKSRLYLDKKEHTAMVLAVNSALKEAPAPKFQGQKVVLAGILAEPNAFLDVFDDLNLAVVGDELAQESRQFRVPVPAEGAPGLERLARQWQNVEGCCLVADQEKTRTKRIADMAKQQKADGVVFVQMKFCDPDEFDYPWIKKELDARGIPVLNIEIDQQMQSAGQLQTRLQAFSEQLSMM